MKHGKNKYTQDIPLVLMVLCSAACLVGTIYAAAKKGENNRKASLILDGLEQRVKDLEKR